LKTDWLYLLHLLLNQWIAFNFDTKYDKNYAMLVLSDDYSEFFHLLFLSLNKNAILQRWVKKYFNINRSIRMCSVEKDFMYIRIYDIQKDTAQ